MLRLVFCNWGAEVAGAELLLLFGVLVVGVLVALGVLVVGDGWFRRPIWIGFMRGIPFMSVCVSQAPILPSGARFFSSGKDRTIAGCDSCCVSPSRLF